MKEKLDAAANMNTTFFYQKVEHWLKNKDISQLKNQSSLSEQGRKAEETRYVILVVYYLVKDGDLFIVATIYSCIWVGFSFLSLFCVMVFLFKY